MKATRLTLHRTIFLALALLLTSLILPPVAAADSLSPEQAIQRAWRAAHDAGVYHFTSDVVQTSYPAPALGNVGRSSTRNQLHLEGDVDLPARTMQMRMWTGAGSVANPDSAAEMRIEGNRAWARQGGGSWQEVEDFSGGFAPGGDFLSYLVGVKNVERGGSRRPRLRQLHARSTGELFARQGRAAAEPAAGLIAHLPADDRPGRNSARRARPAAPPDHPPGLPARQAQRARRGGHHD